MKALKKALKDILETLSQYPDELDLDMLNDGSVEEYFRKHAKALIFCIEKGMDSNSLNELLCLAAVKQDGHAAQYLSSEQRTPEVCLAAVKQDGVAVQYLTAEQRTPEVCLAAVKQCGMAVYYLTAEQRTPEVCVAAIEKDGIAFYYLTAEQRKFLEGI